MVDQALIVCVVVSLSLLTQLSQLLFNRIKQGGEQRLAEVCEEPLDEMSACIQRVACPARLSAVRACLQSSTHAYPAEASHVLVTWLQAN